MIKRRSFVLVMALLIASSLAIMVGGFSISVLYKNQAYMKYINSQKAYYMASAGAQYGRYKYQRWYNAWYDLQQSNDIQFPDDTFSIPAANAKITVKYAYDKTSNILEIHSSAVTKSATREVLCEIDGGEPSAFYSLYYTRKAPILKWR